MQYFKYTITLLVFIICFEFVMAQAPVISSFTPVTGGQWTNITITGTNFTGTTEVSFGGVQAGYFYIVSNTQIIAYVGSGATGMVTVTNASGSGSKTGFTFIPPPVITAINPAIAGLGDTVTIKGSNFINITNVDFGDSAALSFTVFTDTLIKAVVGNGTSGQVAVFGDYGAAYITGFVHTGPTISSFSPTSGSSGTVVKIKGTQFTAATKVSFGNINAASFIVTADTLITATVGTGGPGDVLVKTPKGTVSAPGFIVPTISNFSPQSGTRGTLVTIKGSNFTGTTSVRFGDTAAASFTVLSDTVINATVGNGNTGEVRVTNGTLFASAYYFYYNIPHALLNSFSPTAGTNGTTVTIRGTNLTGTSIVRFGGTNANSFVVQSDTVITAVVGNGSSGYVFVNNNNIQDSLGYFYFQISKPFISSFSPVAGPAGTSVIISGGGFSSTIANNIVFFGAALATVTAASFNTITVTVPAGATYQPISASNSSSNLIGYSNKPFTLTFPGAMAGFSALSFDNGQRIVTTGSNPYKVIAADFNGDGKTDIAVTYGYFGSNNNTVSVYKNIGNNGNINFASPVNYTIGTQGYAGYDIAAADMDGDGKLDLIALSSGDNIVGIMKNTSSNGNISFALKVDFITGSSNGPEGTNSVNVTVSDFDGDGKPDLAFANFGLDNWCKVSYIKNTTVNGVISFGARTDYPIVDAYSVFARDLNNDNKPDIAVCINVNGTGMKQLATLNNTSSAGTVSFQQNDGFGASNSIKSYVIGFGDIDNDGKTDMVTANGNTSSVTVFKNTSTDAGLLNFSNYTDYTIGGYAVRGVCISDADGDGKPDIIASSANGNKFSILKNTSTVGNISFAINQDYTTPANPQNVIAADLNGDGIPEIITANQNDSSIAVYKNNIGNPLKLCPPAASSSLTSNITGNNYQWQVSTNNGVTFNNIVNNSNYSGVTTNNLQLNNLPTSFTGYQYRCAVNAVNSNSYKIQFVNNWSGAINSNWNNTGNWSCGALPDGNTDVIIRTGNVILNANGICRTITVLPGASFTVSPGITLTITN